MYSLLFSVEIQRDWTVITVEDFKSSVYDTEKNLVLLLFIYFFILFFYFFIFFGGGGYTAG